MRHKTKKESPMTHFSKLALIALCIVMSFSACRKEEDTIALIKVRDVEMAPVADAIVTLFADPTNSSGDNVGNVIEEVSQPSNAAGEAIFDFTELYQDGQAGFAVLSILIEKDSLMVEGIIKIDPEVVNEETLILQ